VKVSILIPAYNEAATIAEVVRRVAATPLPGVDEREIVLVDDHSTDGTETLARALQLAPPPGIAAFHLERHDRNRGKGAAVRTAIARASGEIAVIQDADLEYAPEDIPKLIEPLLDGRADAVFGSRFLGGPHRVLYFWHHVANRFLTLFSNMLTNFNCSDMETGAKAFRLDVLRALGLKSERFGIEPEITARLARGGYRLYEVPVSYSGRTYAQGKKITWRDGIAALWWIVRYRFFR
jgi:glycosyltransferase involved in cell wall biosynthesis